MIIRRGILQTFDSATYTATVLFLESTSYVVTVPVSNAIDGTSALPGAICAVLFFDEHYTGDAMLFAIIANGSSGLPSPAPGRITLVTGQKQINNVTINSGTTSTFTLTGGATNIPAGALGVLYRAFFTAAAASAFIQMAPHGATISNYEALGAIQVANSIVHGSGILAVDSAGKIDIQALNANCTLTLYTYGYII